MEAPCRFCSASAEHTIAFGKLPISVIWLRTCTHHLEQAVAEGVGAGLGVVGVDDELASVFGDRDR